MAEQIEYEDDNGYDNGYDTDYEHEHDHDHEYDANQDLDITDEQYVLLTKYILDTINPDAYKISKMSNQEGETIPQLLTKIIQQNLIKFNQLQPDLTISPHNDGVISHAYLHSPEIENKIYEFLSPRISKEEYDSINALYPDVEEIDYGSKFIETIKFYNNFIIIIFSLNEEEKEEKEEKKEKKEKQLKTQCILKIDRYNDVQIGLPILTVYAGGNNIILDWNHPTQFRNDPTQFSKLVFRKNGIITDIYWTDLQGKYYRNDLLPFHIALRPNRFDNCWYLDYNSHLKLPDDTFEAVKFSIHCCDS